MTSLSVEADGKIKATLTEAVNHKRTSALIFGATSAERELCFATAGPRTLDDPLGEPVTPDSILWICSQSKLILTIAAFQLVEAGRLDFDAPVAGILPELANPVILSCHPMLGKPSHRPAKEEMKIKHLFNHSSGLFYHVVNDDLIPYSTRYGLDRPIEQFYNIVKGDYPGVPLLYEPGTSFSYGYSSDTLGFIVERITGQTLDEYYKEHIFFPLGINGSFYLTPDLKTRLVSLSLRKPDGIVPDRSHPFERDPKKVNLCLAGTGVYLSMRDYLALLRHLLQVLAGTAVKPIIQTASLQTFFQPSLTPAGNDAVRQMANMLGEVGDSWSSALCINNTDVPGRRKKGSGWWYGYAGSYHFIDPETGVAAVLGSQLIPSRDPEVVKLWVKLEEIFYAGLHVQTLKN